MEITRERITLKESHLRMLEVQCEFLRNNENADSEDILHSIESVLQLIQKSLNIKYTNK
jgi:UDP-N-acetylenolpyruvoylglucosamine reductase